MKTCKMLQGISQGTGVKIEEVLCLDECGMGPNVEIAGRIVNGVKTEADVKAIFDWTRTEVATEEEEEKQETEVEADADADDGPKLFLFGDDNADAGGLIL